MAERAAHNVGAYGGLGAHGLDFGADGGPVIDGAQARKEQEASFSTSALHCAPKIVDEFDEDEDYEE
jgi:hypothetical protein